MISVQQLISNMTHDVSLSLTAGLFDRRRHMTGGFGPGDSVYRGHLTEGIWPGSILHQ